MYLNLPSFIVSISPICLTLTWDVFKFDSLGREQNATFSLTLTWDVFKFIMFSLLNTYVFDKLKVDQNFN